MTLISPAKRPVLYWLIYAISTLSSYISFTGDPDTLDRREPLMQAIDSINTKHGLRLVRHATEGMSEHRWYGKREKRSPSHTSSWSDIPAVRAS
jgi:hypothetical protein